MTHFDVDLVLDCQCELAEGPIWDERDGSLYFVDIPGHNVHRFDPATGAQQTWSVGQMIGAVLLTSDPQRVVVACHHGFYYLDLSSGALTAIVDPESDRGEHTRFNDGKADPQGRIWAGTAVMGGGEHNSGALYRLDADGGVSQHLTGIQCSNGLAWSADSSVMYYIDSPQQSIDRLVFDADSGVVSDRQVFISIDQQDGVPDGMCIDDNGNLWVAHWKGEKVVCFDGANGTPLHTIAVPSLNVTSCCFGGPDRDILYITTARRDANTDVFPHAGGIFSCKPGVSGPTPILFSGA